MKNVETLAINKIVATTLIILMSTMSVFAFNAITVSAHNPPYQMPTWIYCVENPSPVGVGQPIIIFWWLDDILPTTNGQYGDRVSTSPLRSHCLMELRKSGLTKQVTQSAVVT